MEAVKSTGTTSTTSTNLHSFAFPSIEGDDAFGIVAGVVFSRVRPRLAELVPPAGQDALGIRRAERVLDPGVVHARPAPVHRIRAADGGRGVLADQVAIGRGVDQDAEIMRVHVVVRDRVVVGAGEQTDTGEDLVRVWEIADGIVLDEVAVALHDDPLDRTRGLLVAA